MTAAPLYEPYLVPPLHQFDPNSSCKPRETQKRSGPRIGEASCTFFIFSFSCLGLNRQIKALQWVWPAAKYITPRVCLQASCRYVKIWIRIRLGASKSITAESFFRALHADAGGRTDSLKVDVADMKWDLILFPKKPSWKWLLYLWLQSNWKAGWEVLYHLLIFTGMKTPFFNKLNSSCPKNVQYIPKHILIASIMRGS